MSIIEQLQEIKKEQDMKVDLSYNLTPRQWKVYNYLKQYAIGVENARSAETIVYVLQYDYDIGTEYDKRQLRHDIRAIRTTMPRRIGSSSKGYWLMTSDDELIGTSMMMKQFISIAETLILQGINPSLLHSIIGAYAKSRGKEIDNQLTLKITEHLREVIHTLSDDLKGE